MLTDAEVRTLAENARRSRFFAEPPPGRLSFVFVQILATIGAAICFAEFTAVLLHSHPVPTVAVVQLVSILMIGLFVSVPGLFLVKGRVKALIWLKGAMFASIAAACAAPWVGQATGAEAVFWLLLLGITTCVVVLLLVKQQAYKKYLLFTTILHER